MMYHYLTLADGTEVVHSELLDEEQGERMLVHFERPTTSGFDSVRFELPSYEMEVWEGSFSDVEIASLRDFLESNAHQLYQHAQHRNPEVFGSNCDNTDVSCVFGLYSNSDVADVSNCK